MKVGFVRRAILEASKAGLARYREISRTQNDMGRTAFLLLRECAAELKPEAISLKDVDSQFQALSQAPGPAAKTSTLTDLLRRLHPTDSKYIVRLARGDLGIGLQPGLLEDAVAKAFNEPASKVRHANMLLGSIGMTAVLAAAHQLDKADIQPLTPVRCMLASQAQSSGDIWHRLAGERSDSSATAGPPHVWLEDQLHGIRAQLHKRGPKVAIYSRDLRPLSTEFPELVELGKQIDADLIADGVIIAGADGKSLGSIDLAKRRSRRNEPDLFLGPDIPVRFVLFDLLWHRARSCIEQSLSTRRALLDQLVLPRHFERVPVQMAESIEAIDKAFEAARQRSHRSLIAKNPAGSYSPGRESKAWLKLESQL